MSEIKKGDKVNIWMKYLTKYTNEEYEVLGVCEGMFIYEMYGQKFVAETVRKVEV